MFILGWNFIVLLFLEQIDNPASRCLHYSERTPQFVVQAYLEGPQNVNLEETGPSWLKFEQALSNYEATKRFDSYYFRL